MVTGLMKKLFKIYSLTVNGRKSIFFSGIRFFIKLVLNYVYPVFFLINRRKYILDGSGGVIISLTTFPDRIEKTWLVVECMLRQTIKPDKVVLTLSKLQFESECGLPRRLLEQKERGLEIIWTDDDIRSHKKYYDVMKKYPSSVVVTVDDDFFYESTMLEKLLEFHALCPNCVVCNLAALKIGNQYSDWENLYFSRVEPTYNIMQYGGSGVLYPPNCLYKDAFDKSVFLNICPLADDIWLNYMAMLNGTKIVKTDYRYYLVPILFKSNQELYKVNVLKNQNDEQLRNLNVKYAEMLKSIVEINDE